MDDIRYVEVVNARTSVVSCSAFRSTLICNMLSYVDFYRPKYFLLENVTGLLYFRPGAKQLGQSMVGGVSMGIVKFIFRTLISLGYGPLRSTS